jgi:hypothetical protein
MSHTFDYPETITTAGTTALPWELLNGRNPNSQKIGEAVVAAFREIPYGLFLGKQSGLRMLSMERPSLLSVTPFAAIFEDSTSRGLVHNAIGYIRAIPNIPNLRFDTVVEAFAIAEPGQYFTLDTTALTVNFPQLYEEDLTQGQSREELMLEKLMQLARKSLELRNYQKQVEWEQGHAEWH